MAASSSKAEPETCVLCPSSGPPVRPVTSGTAPAADGGASDGEAAQPIEPEQDEMVWIACSKCGKWYHSVCVLRSGTDWRATVPAELVGEDEDEWVNWTERMEKWYCRPCLDWSVNPENPRPPRHPIVATIKALKNKAPSKRLSTVSAADSPTAKKPRLGSSRPSSAALDDKNDQASSSAPSSSRPKRKAAENAPDYYAWNHGIAAPTTKWLQLIADPAKYGKDIQDADYPHIPATLLSKSWLDSASDPTSSFPAEFPPSLFYGPDRKPLVITQKDGGFEGMGGLLPNKNLKVTDVAEQAGPIMTVDVIDYFVKASDPDYTGKVYNVISLEITGTPLAKRVRPPRIVREIDWVDNCWHFAPKGKGNTANDDVDPEPKLEVQTNGSEPPKGKAPLQWPKVQLYCLMGIRGSWTDWHVDFAASSVYYTIHTGAKEFYFIEPTERNLKAYGEWSGSAESQQNVWLGDMVEGGVKRVRLNAGDTMIIPAGYIHAVYTPQNSIVFGGNFVHNYSIHTQLRLRQIEIDTKVPQRFRFPLFDKLCWYVADKHCAELRALRSYRPRSTKIAAKPPAEVILRGLIDLAKFLQSQVNIMEDEEAEEKRRKLVFDRIPAETVRDPAGLARELLWRASRELHLPEGEVHEVRESQPVNGVKGKGKAAALRRDIKLDKRKVSPYSRKTDFDPPSWDQRDHPVERTSTTVEMRRPALPGRPADDDMGQGPEIAGMVTEVCRQQRTRRRFLGDGTVILEEQEVVFTERKTTWPPAPVKSEVPIKEARDTVQNEAPAVEVATQDTGAAIPVAIAV
ncbi:JmjC domain-containing histone demethylation protein 1 [Saitozyma sp. JCM 24511]|nr:JmjC domain-containing histone demethylation protein 1 [Saitozyma sp. JCM 24511]